MGSFIQKKPYAKKGIGAQRKRALKHRIETSLWFLLCPQVRAKVDDCLPNDEGESAYDILLERSCLGVNNLLRNPRKLQLHP